MYDCDLFLASIVDLLRKRTSVPWWRLGLCLKSYQNSMLTCINTLYIGIQSRYSEFPTDWTIRDSNPAGGELFPPSLKRPDRFCGLQFPVQWTSGGSFSCRQWAGPCRLSLTPSSADVQNEWSFISNSPVCLHGVCRENRFLTYNLSESSGRWSVSLSGQQHGSGSYFVTSNHASHTPKLQHFEVRWVFHRLYIC